MMSPKNEISEGNKQMNVRLKIKAKHLALEPAIIKKEERKLLDTARYLRDKGSNSEKRSSVLSEANSLHNHRTINVRNESRATYLAIAYIRNIPYRSVEAYRRNEYTFNYLIVPRILKMINKYSPTREFVSRDDVLAWAK